MSKVSRDKCEDKDKADELMPGCVELDPDTFVSLGIIARANYRTREAQIAYWVNELPDSKKIIGRE